MKRKLSNIILILILLIGLSLLLYPTVSDYVNSMNQSKAIAVYMENVADIDNDEYDAMWKSAELYNMTLLEDNDRWSMTEEEEAAYLKELNVTGDGAMGYIEIPNIECMLPVYHGVEEDVLQVAIGHIGGTSLPVGGTSTHSVLSGHRGLPSAELFTNLDKLKEGDTFLLHILDEVLTYEVDQIRIVEPEDVEELEILEGMDLCTLVTCTPYGVNSHRMLVRGHRIETVNEQTVRVGADAMQIDTMVVALALAIPVLFLLVIFVLIHYRKR